MHATNLTVLSDDEYLVLGLTGLFQHHQGRKYYFVDTDRTGSYSDIYNFINSTPHDAIIIMIRRGGINSLPLQVHGGISVDEPIKNWIAIVRTLANQKESRNGWLLLLSTYITGRNLTDRQRLIRFYFKSTSNVKLVAKKLHLSEKTVWSHLDLMYKKHNFSKFRDFVTFIRTN